MSTSSESARLVGHSHSGRHSGSYGSIKESNSIFSSIPRFICTRRDTIIVLILLVLATVVIVTTLVIGLPKIEEKRLQYLDTSFKVSSSPLRTYASATVLSDGNECASIGKSMLQMNGSAVDAALATLFCNGVVTPQSMGLGGGFFMVVYSKESGTSEVIDARETAPEAATVDMFHGNSSVSYQGGLSIAVPGELKGYWAAHKRYGKLNWATLVEPAIELCVNGFTVSQSLAKKLNDRKTAILDSPSMREEFFNNDTNELYREGEVMKRPVLAQTLKAIAEEGSDALYGGKRAQDFVKDIADCGGIISTEDLYSYEPKFKSSIKISVRDGPSPKTWHVVPPPGSGVVTSLVFHILQGYNLTSENLKNVDGAALVYHRIAEAFKFAFAHRERLGDAEFVNISQIVNDMVSKEYGESIRQKISDARTYAPQYYESVLSTANDEGTAHVSVLAPNGDAVSVTSTINSNFGSLCRSPSTGIILNNNMDDFSSPNITNQFGLKPYPANFIQAGKRPLSSMCPSILVNDDSGDVQMVMGGMGGSRIITATMQVMIRVLWLDETIKEATDALRIHHQLNPNALQYEEGFPKIYLDKLKTFGHQIQTDKHNNEVLCIVRDEAGLLNSVVDYRKSGSVDGF